MSGKSSNEWVTRGATGVVFVAVVMGAVAWSSWTNAGLWALVAALAWAEWAKAPEFPQAKFPKALSILFPVPALAALVWLWRRWLRLRVLCRCVRRFGWCGGGGGVAGVARV